MSSYKRFDNDGDHLQTQWLPSQPLFVTLSIDHLDPDPGVYPVSATSGASSPLFLEPVMGPCGP
jgi:hypothetical protein